MKGFSHLAFVAVTSLLLTGCLLKQRPTVSPRHFVLTVIPAKETASDTNEQLSLGIGFVKMPAYLLRHAMAVRNGTNEIEYLENALWAERLDQCFQRTLAANLSRLLPSDNIPIGIWRQDQVQARLFINVQQFDVDSRGRGTLIANWRITAPDNDAPLKNGRARLAREGTPPHGKPDIIARTLSDLVAEFSRELVQPLRESARSSP